ncbi:hypothetical protein [Burkholderia sp. BCC1977]|uniref:hypothetical protein n=1 Tax=Burkholderia sp. BCC1977 TaxID=2817440 RepID=UPI002ABE9154|nr:hypothetical protein [Burkholderia sp. BCC1977]
MTMLWGFIAQEETDRIPSGAIAVARIFMRRSGSLLKVGALSGSIIVRAADRKVDHGTSMRGMP